MPESPTSNDSHREDEEQPESSTNTGEPLMSSIKPVGRTRTGKCPVLLQFNKKTDFDKAQRHR